MKLDITNHAVVRYAQRIMGVPLSFDDKTDERLAAEVRSMGISPEKIRDNIMANVNPLTISFSDGADIVLRCNKLGAYLMVRDFKIITCYRIGRDAPENN